MSVDVFLIYLYIYTQIVPVQCVYVKWIKRNGCLVQLINLKLLFDLFLICCNICILNILN